MHRISLSEESGPQPAWTLSTNKSSSSEVRLATVATLSREPDGKNMVVSIPRGLLERLGEELVGALSERETEIVLLTAHGHSNYQIGREPSLSEATVKRHLAIIYSKIGVRSRSSGSTLTTSPPPTRMARAPDSGCYSPKCLEEVFSEVRAAALRVAS